jgi:hypothetical protein
MSSELVAPPPVFEMTQYPSGATDQKATGREAVFWGDMKKKAPTMVGVVAAF